MAHTILKLDFYDLTYSILKFDFLWLDNKIADIDAPLWHFDRILNLEVRSVKKKSSRFKMQELSISNLSRRGQTQWKHAYIITH